MFFVTFKKSMMIIEMMIIHVYTDRVTISNVGLREKTETKRQQCLWKTSDSLYIKLVGRKIANMTITVELEHVKALFNFLYLSPNHKVFACGYLKKLILMYK